MLESYCSNTHTHTHTHRNDGCTWTTKMGGNNYISAMPDTTALIQRGSQWTVVISTLLSANLITKVIDKNQSHSGFFTARRYASAVHAMTLCPSVCLSVCLSVCHKLKFIKPAKHVITQTRASNGRGLGKNAIFNQQWDTNFKNNNIRKKHNFYGK